MTRFRSCRLGLALLALTAAANATTFTFDTDPFAGTNVVNVPGRQIVGGEAFLAFDTANDVYSLKGSAFGVSGPVHFVNAAADLLPATGVNIVVLETFDDDNNPLTPFGAGNAANLIASRVTTSAPGFFVYFNQGLNLPRLVYSTDLSSTSSDLRILSRMLNLMGQPGRDALPGFTARNFDITSTPEPSTVWMVVPGLAAGWSWMRRRRIGGPRRGA